MKHKQGIVGRMTKGVASLFKSKGVEYVEGEARLAAAGRVSVEGAGLIEAGRVLLATGSSPVELPDLPFDGQRILSSQEALSLEAVPARMAVIGAGAIGLEMGSVWSRLGAGVEVVEYLDAVLPGADGEISRQLERTLKRQGLKFHLSTRATGAETCDSDVRLHLARGRGRGHPPSSATTCSWPWAAGRTRRDSASRRPASTATGPASSPSTRTTAPASTGSTPSATSPPDRCWPTGRGRGRGRRGAHGRPGIERQLRGHPNVVYNPPRVASVGLTEEQAREAGHDARTGRSSFRANARAHTMNAPDGFAKVVADAASDRLLGVHILGPQASHLIAEPVLALEFGASAEDLARTVHAHPASRRW